MAAEPDPWKRLIRASLEYVDASMEPSFPADRGPRRPERAEPAAPRQTSRITRALPLARAMPFPPIRASRNRWTTEIHRSRAAANRAHRVSDPCLENIDGDRKMSA